MLLSMIFEGVGCKYMKPLSPLPSVQSTVPLSVQEVVDTRPTITRTKQYVC